MKKLLFASVLIVTALSLRAGIVIGPWEQLFKGIEHAAGTNSPDADIPVLQVSHCMKIDLSDPDVQLFTTPRHTNYVAGTVETSTLIVSNFLKRHHLAVASDANFYGANPGGSDPTSEGLPCRVYGLQVCTGSVVSVPDTGPDSNGRYMSLLFTTNKMPILAWNNRPPGVDTTGIYTAISGYYPVLSNGINIGAQAAIAYPDSFVHDYQPRTLIGVSQDRRYLFMATIDGRQPGYSDGATDPQSALWLQEFGVWDAINMDGGGSTAMYRADCAGNPVAVNHSSYIGVSGGRRERIIGSHFGVSARPLETSLRDLKVTPGTTTALLEWTTPDPANTRVEYGPMPSYGSATPLDPLPRMRHVAILSGLTPRTTYYYQALSVSGADTLSSACSFMTTNSSSASTLVFDVNAAWKYTSNYVDSVNWMSPAYNDSGWSGPGAGLLYIENNTLVTPRNTPLPSPVMRTYYFRRHFNFTGNRSDASLSFSAYVDDGLVMYLNGSEIYRLRMPSGAVDNQTGATGQPCVGTGAANDATCADTFTVGNSLLTSLVQGDNVLAVEVHNYLGSSGSLLDLVFGTAMTVNHSTIDSPTLHMITENSLATLYWNAEGFTLQRSTDLNVGWEDVPGPITIGPISVTTSPTTYYRLRR
jgi:hypothetical protein